MIDSRKPGEGICRGCIWRGDCEPPEDARRCQYCTPTERLDDCRTALLIEAGRQLYRAEYLRELDDEYAGETSS